jgi:hypothetical protein
MLGNRVVGVCDATYWPIAGRSWCWWSDNVGFVRSRNMVMLGKCEVRVSWMGMNDMWPLRIWQRTKGEGVKKKTWRAEREKCLLWCFGPLFRLLTGDCEHSTIELDGPLVKFHRQNGLLDGPSCHTSSTQQLSQADSVSKASQLLSHWQHPSSSPHSTQHNTTQQPSLSCTPLQLQLPSHHSHAPYKNPIVRSTVSNPKSIYLDSISSLHSENRNLAGAFVFKRNTKVIRICASTCATLFFRGSMYP